MISLRNKRSAFTLIELLAVISIIGILMGMIGGASFAARQSGYKAQAQAEVREIANACRAYWISSGTWKGGNTWPGGVSGQATISRGGDVYKALTGDNQAGVVFLQVDEERFAPNGGTDENVYLDPWGNPYEISFDDEETVEYKQKFSTSVTFPMRNRYKYYGHQFGGGGN